MEISVTLKKINVSLTKPHVAFDQSKLDFNAFIKGKGHLFCLHNTCKMKHQEFLEEWPRNVELNMTGNAPDRKTYCVT